MTRDEQMRRNPLVVLAAGVLLAGCWTGAGITDVGADLGEPFVVRVGQAVTLDDGGITLLFAGVPEDSRCAADVVCVWEGNAVVALTATAGGSEEAIELNTSASPAVGPRQVVVDGYAVELLQLDPTPLSDHPIPGWTYRATLKVSRVYATTAAEAAP
jgi:predicted small secreted protein